MRTTILIGLVALLTSAACSDETGILVKVKTAEGFTESIDHLRFYVGEDAIGDPLYFADTDPIPDIPLNGRNLADKPYSLLIRPRDSGDENERIAIGVLAFGTQSDDPIGTAFIRDPVSFVPGVVTEWELFIGPLGPDYFPGDNGCLKWMVGDDYMHVGREGDLDCDGTTDDLDCNDLNPEVKPGQPEICDNGIDDDCDESIDGVDGQGNLVDGDNDEYYACDPDFERRDCNDGDINVNPGRVDDPCNGQDDNCSGICDDGFDEDGDRVTSCGSVLDSGGACVGYDSEAPDCKPNDETVYPGAIEVANGKDDNCSDACDDDPALDTDGDGFTEWGQLGVCGYQEGYQDCNLNDATIHPGAQEYCDGIDSDCNEDEIDGSPCYEQNGTDCRQGYRRCTDGVLEDACTESADPANPLPDEICATYAACQGVPDPYECVADLAGMSLPTETCRTLRVSSGPCQGGSATILLPVNPPLVNCSYELIGGFFQQGYLVEIQPVGNGGDGLFVNACDAHLTVEPQLGANDATITIIFDNGNGISQVLEVKLENHPGDTCAPPGLSCETWPGLG
jgi:hypothetical protein